MLSHLHKCGASRVAHRKFRFETHMWNSLHTNFGIILTSFLGRNELWFLLDRSLFRFTWGIKELKFTRKIAWTFTNRLRKCIFSKSEIPRISYQQCLYIHCCATFWIYFIHTQINESGFSKMIFSLYRLPPKQWCVANFNVMCKCIQANYRLV